MLLLLPTLELYTLLRLFLMYNTVPGHKWAATLSPKANSNLGEWGPWEHCPTGMFVSRFLLKVQDDQGTGGDNTALNAVSMLCSNRSSQGGHYLKSAAGQWGRWRHYFDCENFYTGIWFNSQPNQLSGDNTAGNSVALVCDGNWHDGGVYGMNWGKWTDEQYCPDKSAICGLRTKVQPPQGAGDDTALNAVEVQCCYR